MIKRQAHVPFSPHTVIKIFISFSSGWHNWDYIKSYLMCCKDIYFLLLNWITDYVRCKDGADQGGFGPIL